MCRETRIAVVDNVGKRTREDHSRRLENREVPNQITRGRR